MGVTRHLNLLGNALMVNSLALCTATRETHARPRGLAFATESVRFNADLTTERPVRHHEPVPPGTIGRLGASPDEESRPAHRVPPGYCPTPALVGPVEIA